MSYQETASCKRNSILGLIFGIAGFSYLFFGVFGFWIFCFANVIHPVTTLFRLCFLILIFLCYLFSLGCAIPSLILGIHALPHSNMRLITLVCSISTLIVHLAFCLSLFFRYVL